MGINFNSNSNLNKLLKQFKPQQSQEQIKPKETRQREDGMWEQTQLGKEKSQRDMQHFYDVINHRGGNAGKLNNLG